ncbi:hypothetical protein ACWGS9_06525 [Bradyrhizobium sp. Arg314]
MALVAKEHPALIKTVNDNFTTVDTILAKYKTADGPTTSCPTPTERR